VIGGAVAAAAAPPRRRYYYDGRYWDHPRRTTEVVVVNRGRPAPRAAEVVVVNAPAPAPPPAAVVYAAAPARPAGGGDFPAARASVVRGERPPGDANNGERDAFQVVVQARDGASYQITRRFGEFKRLADDPAFRMAVRPGDMRNPFPAKCRGGFFSPAPSAEQQRALLHNWLEELVKLANAYDYSRRGQRYENLKGPLLNFLDFEAQYNIVVQEATSAPTGGLVASNYPMAAAAPAPAAQPAYRPQGGEAPPPAYPAAAAAASPPTAPAPPTAYPVLQAEKAPSQSSANNPFAAPAPKNFSAANPFAQDAAAAAPVWPVAAGLERYRAVFNAHGPANGVLSPAAAREALLATGVPTEVLRELWEQVDLDGSGNLDLEEFALALYLCEQVKSGKPLARTLPAELMPPSRR